MRNKNDIKNFIVFVSLSAVFLSFNFVKASSSEGLIDSVYKYAQGIDNKNIKINFGLFKGAINVRVTDTGLTGYAWGENIGWVNLSPTNGGVVNNGEGSLSGYATSEFGGWINFKPDSNGVKINSDGFFTGYAMSEKFGRISFNCTNDNSCDKDNFKVKTDWRPISVRGGTITHPVLNPSSSNTPPVNDTNANNTNDTNENINKIKPLPVVNNGQYQSGGDVVKYNGQMVDLEVGGGITYTLPTDNPVFVPDIDGAKDTAPVIVANIASKTKEITSAIKTQSDFIGYQAQVVSNDRAVDISTKTVTTVGVVGGSTTLLSSLASSALSVSEFFLNFIRLWSLFLSAIGLKKKRKPWGTVYDSVTKQPLDPVYVVLADKNNKEVATAITDLDGRFGFMVPSGRYRMIVKKNNYIFPSKNLSGQEKDELYDNLYFGEDIDLDQDNLVIRNIPMDPQGFDWNEFTKKEKNILKFSSSNEHIWVRISNLLFYLGFILALVLLIINKFNYYNIAVIGIYLVLFIFRKVNFKPKTYGTLMDKNTRLPISFGIVRIFMKGNDKEMFHRVADKYGNYYCLLSKGEYYITIEKKNDDGSYQKVHISEPFIIKNGILNKDFEV